MVRSLSLNKGEGKASEDALAIEHNTLYDMLQAMQRELSNPIKTVAVFAGRLDY